MLPAKQKQGVKHQLTWILKWNCSRDPGPSIVRMLSVTTYYMGLLPDKLNCGLRMRQECQERFPRHRGLAIPTCITARA